MGKPFKPISTVDLAMVVYKTVFLIAFTLAHRINELGTLNCDLLFLKFHLDKLLLRLSIIFLPKVVSEFPLYQDSLASPTSHATFPAERSLHILEDRRCLLVDLI